MEQEQYGLYRYVFDTIAAMRRHGVVLYGFGQHGKRWKAFCEGIGLNIRSIYDRDAKYKSSGG